MEIKGRDIAETIYADLKTRVGELQKKGVTPHLAVILVGDDPASQVYVKQKQRHGQNINCLVDVFNFPSNINESEIIETVRKLNTDPGIHGIIIQRPLPKQINPDLVEDEIDDKKDVDGFKPQSLFQVPIVLATLKILEVIFTQTNGVTDFKSWLSSKNIVLIGKGSTAGKPLFEYFNEIGAHVSLIDSKTENPKQVSMQADILISSVGKEHIVAPDMLSRGVILISVGISRGIDGKLHGDYETNEIQGIASFYTPTPGGVGPVNVAMLLENLVTSAKSS